MLRDISDISARDTRPALVTLSLIQDKKEKVSRSGEALRVQIILSFKCFFFFFNALGVVF